MKLTAALFAVVMLVSCEGKDAPRPLSEPGEKIYPLRAVILSRSAADNSLRLDHEPVEGFMPAMVMDYTVRGRDVATLPSDKSRIEARLHVTSNGYWLTDVKPLP